LPFPVQVGGDGVVEVALLLFLLIFVRDGLKVPHFWSNTILPTNIWSKESRTRRLNQSIVVQTAEPQLC
jgi:hypothetical protein